ncbi:MAG: T9SS type A sorting domain-containing protein [Phaeodactylibacter sp.]|nr:T9SS type A sorting domain-containing protein [Phaeodactylibacter sp.]MCB9274689.1 T9SS type A sorting domain-containing protein [Lewinellaceae bacterium]
MKNVGLIFLFSMGLLATGKAQITITDAVFPEAGDTLFFAMDTQPGQVVMTAPGGGQQWDLSGLQPSFTFEQVYQDAQSGPDYGSFPSATLYYQTGNGNVNTYLNVNGQQVAALGFSGPDQSVLGLDLVARYAPPLVQSRAPVQFFDIKQASTGLLLPFDASMLPGVGQLPIAPPDSMRLRIAINRLDAVDAWGALSIPGGTYDVLREKRTEFRETRLDAKIPVLGWLDITDVALQYLSLNALGVDTAITYYFLNDQSKEPIAICTTDNGGLQVVSVQYKNAAMVTAVKKAVQPAAVLAVFPNPAEDVLHIRASGLAGEHCTVRAFSILGQEVYRKACTGTSSGKLEEELDIAGLEKGVYVCKLTNDREEMAQALFVKR